MQQTAVKFISVIKIDDICLTYISMVSISDSINHYIDSSCCMRNNPSALQHVYDGVIVNAILFFIYLSAYMNGMHSLCLCAFTLIILISISILVNYRLHVSDVEKKNTEFLEDELLRLITKYNTDMKKSLLLCGIDQSDESDESDDDMPPLINASDIHYDNNIINLSNQIYSQNIPVVREILEASQNNLNKLD